MSVRHSENVQPPRRILQRYCTTNVQKFVQETSIHGLKYITDRSITVWERSFFLLSVIAALVTAMNLISNIYAKWESTPVIIGISPHPTSILNIPFPAITICNMNQAQLSKVSHYSEDSSESAMLKLLCLMKSELKDLKSTYFDNNSLKLSDFVIEHAQPCTKLLVSCKMSYSTYNCSDLFREVITDEGLCCVFNVLHPQFLFHGNYTLIKDFTQTDGSIPVDWDPETGYPENLPEVFYPRPATGTGVSMGLSIILNAELDEYFCSSTNGPGFKISMHNPIDTPHIKETGLTIPIGFETRFRIDAVGSEAAANVRSVHRDARQCVFNDEETLIYYKYYTRRNCANECQAIYLLNLCNCIPHNLPLIFSNVSACTARDTKCIITVETEWQQKGKACIDRCLPSCFDLSYFPVAFSVPLASENYTIPSQVLQHMDKEYVKKNIASVQIYYRESVFHGDLKNVYIGLTEFLSNTGGIMSLFMGFSFISVAEIIYFIFLRPIFELIVPQNRRKPHPGSTLIQTHKNNIWYSEELHRVRRQIPHSAKFLQRSKPNKRTKHNLASILDN